MTTHRTTTEPAANWPRRGGAPAAQPERVHDCIYPDTAKQPLGTKERRELGMIAARAFAAWAARPENNAERVRQTMGSSKTALATLWRHAEVGEATEGRASGISDLTRADYQAVRGHFLAIAGLDEAAFEALMRAGRTRKGEPKSNDEQAENAIRRVLKEIAEHFRLKGQDEPERRAQLYLSAAVAGRERSSGMAWRSWEPKQKWQVFFTLRNRLHAMQGIGSPGARNKSQREAARRRASED